MKLHHLGALVAFVSFLLLLPVILIAQGAAPTVSVQSKILAGALSGLLAAAAVDFAAFRAFRTLTDLQTYAWQTALTRWVYGAVLGVLGAFGLGAVGA